MTIKTKRRNKKYNARYFFRDNKFFRANKLLGWLDTDGETIEWKSDHLKKSWSSDLDAAIEKAGGLRRFMKKVAPPPKPNRTPVKKPEVKCPEPEEYKPPEIIVEKPKARPKAIALAGSKWQDGMESVILGDYGRHRRRIRLKAGMDGNPCDGILNLYQRHTRTNRYARNMTVWVRPGSMEGVYELVGKYSITGKRIE